MKHDAKLTIRLPRSILRAVDEAVDEGRARSKADFIRKLIEDDLRGEVVSLKPSNAKLYQRVKRTPPRQLVFVGLGVYLWDRRLSKEESQEVLQRVQSSKEKRGSQARKKRAGATAGSVAKGAG